MKWCLGQNFREIDCCSSGSVSGPSSLQEYSETPNKTPPNGEFLRKSLIIGQGFKVGTTLVDSESRDSEREDTGNGIPTNSHPVRCLQDRLGGSLPGTASGGPLVRTRENKTHKYLGTKRGPDGHIDFCREVKSNINPSPDGQHLGISVHSKDGGYSKFGNEPDKQGSLGVPPKIWDHDYCGVPSRDFEWPSGQRVKEERPKRMEIRPKSVPKATLGEGSSNDRFICIEGDNPTPEILLLETRSQKPGNRCFSTGLGSPEGVCLPTIFPDRPCTTKGAEGSSNSATHNTYLANPTMVPFSPKNVYQKSNSVTKVPACLEKLKQLSPTYGMDSIRAKLIADGVSEDSAELILHSRRAGTLSHYESSWRKFHSWCSRREADPFGCPLSLILQFLTDMYKEGRRIQYYRWLQICYFCIPLSYRWYQGGESSTGLSSDERHLQQAASKT